MQRSTLSHSSAFHLIFGGGGHLPPVFYYSVPYTEADQKNSLVSGPPTDPATTPPTVNFLQQSEQKKLMLYKLIC